MLTRLSIPAAAIALLACAQPAIAAPDPGSDIVVRSVTTAGFDLASSTDQAVLRHRIAVAAAHVCAQVVGGTGTSTPGFTECFLRAAADGWTQLDSRVAAIRSKARVASTGGER